MKARNRALTLTAMILVFGNGCDVRPPVLDLDGNAVDLLAEEAPAGRVVIFVRTDCPIANRYVPEIKRLAAEFRPLGVRFTLVYTSHLEDTSDLRKHLADYSIDFDAYRDPSHRFAKFTGASRTPEAIVYTPENRMVYRGRINDQFVDFGQARPEPTQHDLRNALRRLLKNEELQFESTDAVGCYIESGTPARSGPQKQ